MRDSKYHIEFTKEELELVFRNACQGMQLDFRQHTFLTLEQQLEDADSFLERQQVRFSIAVNITTVLKGQLSEKLQSLYKEVEGIMLFARGLGNAENGRADTKTT